MTKHKKVRLSFCPTGQGGGVDNSCGKGSGGKREANKATDKATGLTTSGRTGSAFHAEAAAAHKNAASLQRSVGREVEARAHENWAKFHEEKSGGSPFQAISKEDREAISDEGPKLSADARTTMVTEDLMAIVDGNQGHLADGENVESATFKSPEEATKVMEEIVKTWTSSGGKGTWDARMSKYFPITHENESDDSH
jgi:hypothetical protein